MQGLESMQAKAPALVAPVVDDVLQVCPHLQTPEMLKTGFTGSLSWIGSFCHTQTCEKQQNKDIQWEIASQKLHEKAQKAMIGGPILSDYPSLVLQFFEEVCVELPLRLAGREAGWQADRNV